jgi:hypothetical protein
MAIKILVTLMSKSKMIRKIECTHIIILQKLYIDEQQRNKHAYFICNNYGFESRGWVKSSQ